MTKKGEKELAELAEKNSIPTKGENKMDKIEELFVSEYLELKEENMALKARLVVETKRKGDAYKALGRLKKLLDLKVEDDGKYKVIRPKSVYQQYDGDKYDELVSLLDYIFYIGKEVDEK